MFGGGVELLPAYTDLLHVIATFGYVIAAPHVCSYGCYYEDADGTSTCVSLPDDPKCFARYYEEQLAVFGWAAQRLNDPAFAKVDWASGFGVAGHSMGGQATLFSSSAGNASAYNVKAAVLHHPYTHSFPPPQIPFIVFTGTTDTTAPADTMAQPIFDAPGAASPRGFVNKVGAGHHEPDITSLSPEGVGLLAQYSAAWFKVYLEETPQAFGLDFFSMLFGTDPGSLCGGGDGAMAACTILT
jgi:hypothetical protein